MYKLRTVDVWDTLIRRHSHPETVKLAVAQHIYLGFHAKLNGFIKSHWQIYEARLEVEAELAREAREASKDEEYDLLSVSERLVQRVLADVSRAEVVRISEDLVEYELVFEIGNTFPDPEVAEFLTSYPAEKTIYLSDFYMGSPMLKRLLSHHGLEQVVVEGLVSCDIGLNKRSGRLFEYAQKQYLADASSHVHIGDNPYADVETPRRLGITAVSYLPAKGHSARGSRESIFTSRNALFSHLRALSEQTQQDIPSTLTADQKAAFCLGSQASPLFIGLGLFIAERAIIDSPDRLFFFTREGEFFHHIHTALFPDNMHAGKALPPSSVLCVSRQATFAASLKAATTHELERVWALNSQQKLSTLFLVLDINPTHFSALLRRLGLSLEELLVNPKHDPRIKALFDDSSFSAAIMESATQKRGVLRAYLAQSGATVGKKLGVVDIGWRGTIQDNIAHVMPECGTIGYYLALRAFLNEQPANTEKYAFGPDERTEGDMDFFETFEPLELLCNSNLGSVTGYQWEGDQVIPVRKENGQENSVIDEFTRFFQDGVVAAARVQAPYLKNHAVMSFEMRETALNVWNGLASRPPKQLVAAYYAAPQHDVFGFGGFFNRSDAPSTRALLKALFNRRDRQAVIQYVKRTQWTAAIDGLQIGYVNKLALVIVFWIAHRYKRLRANARMR